MARKKTIIEKLRDHHEHDGHKQRLRERLYKMPDSLADHELLEIILSSSIVRRDTNKIARRLIRNYGSIHNVIEGNPSMLKNEKGLGESTISLFRVLQYLGQRFLQDKSKEYIRILSINQAAHMFKRLMKHYRNETLCAACLEDDGSVISIIEIAQGKRLKIDIKPQVVLEELKKHKPSKVIICHNHTIPSAEPSVEDVHFTDELHELCRANNIDLLEHIVISTSKEFAYILRQVCTSDEPYQSDSLIKLSSLQDITQNIYLKLDKLEPKDASKSWTFDDFAEFYDLTFDEDKNNYWL